MPRPLASPTAFLAAALALACGDQPVAPETGTVRRPELRTEHSPEGPGAFTIKFNVDFVSAGPDPATGLAFTVGLVSPIADVPDCGGDGPVVTDGRLTLKLLFTPNDHVSEFTHIAKSTMVLYRSDSPFFCDWADAPVFGRGPANLTFHLLRRQSDGTPAVLGFKIQGMVDLTGGGRAKVLNTAQVYIQEDGSAIVHVDRFVVKRLK